MSKGKDVTMQNFSGTPCMFVPIGSVEGKIEKIQFLRVSNSKFVIIPLEKYKLCPKNDGVLMVIS